MNLVARRSSLVFVVAILGILVVPSSTAADHGVDSMYPGFSWHDPMCGGTCRADNSSHTVYVGALGSRMHAATLHTLNNSLHTTAINVSYVSSPTYTGPAETDVIYEYAPYMGGALWLGVTGCDDAMDFYRCDQFYISYNGDLIEIWCGSTSTVHENCRKWVACHETGHTVGLMHGSDSNPTQSSMSTAFRCMREPRECCVSYNWPWLITHGDPWLGTHNTHQINGEY